MNTTLERNLLNAGLLTLRLMAGAVLTFHGAQKLFGWFGGYGITGTAGFFEQLGIPFPTASVILAGSAEFFGGLVFLAGSGTRLAAVPVAFTLFVAAFSAHSGFSAQTGGMEYPLTLAVLAVGLGLTGPGRWTVGHLFSSQTQVETYRREDVIQEQAAPTHS